MSLFFHYDTGLAVSNPNRYWVPGGTGNTNSSTNWSLQTGGTSGASVPTITENAKFDGNSGSGTVTVNASFACNDFDSTGFTGTIAGSSAINVKGNFTLGAGITRTFTSAITFSAIATGKLITMNGKTLASTITFNGVGGGWQHADNFTTTGGITLTAGSYDDNGKNISCASFNSSNSNVRSLKLRGTLTNTGAWTTTTTTNLTLDVSGAIIIQSGTGTFASGGLYFAGADVRFTTINGSLTAPLITGTARFGTLRRTNASGYVALYIQNNITIDTAFIATGLDANSGRILISTSTPASPVTITCNGSCTLTNVDFTGIVGAGSATWSGTSVGNCLINSGITFSAPRTIYMVIGTSGAKDYTLTSIWSLSSGGATGVNMPLVQDTIVIDSSSCATTGITLATANVASFLRIPSINFTSATNSPSLSGDANTVYMGNVNLTNASGSANASGVYSGHGITATLTSAGTTLSNGLILQSTGTLQDSGSITSGARITLNQGTFTQSSLLTATDMRMGVSGLTTVYNKGDVVLNTNVGTVFNANNSNLTINDSGYLKVTPNTSSNQTIAGAGFHYNKIWNAMSGTGTLITTGNNTIDTLKADAGRTTQFVGGATQTIGALDISGTVGNNTVFSRSSGSGAYNWVLSSPQTGDRVTISNCTVTGSTLTLTNSTDGGGNTGIIFI